MGCYFNPDNDKFYMAINSEVYIDKSMLIQYTNKVLGTMQNYICVSRPRRFGKSMAANMLAAYYSRGSSAEKLFCNLKIAQDESFEKHLNKYDVLFLNMQEFMSQSKHKSDQINDDDDNVHKMISFLKRAVLWELLEEYPNYRYFDSENLTRTMQDIYQKTKRPFIVIIDEWDCVFRQNTISQEEQEIYLDFLRDLLKDKGYIHLVYMTGILPIKKYGTHSALNMFTEFSMTNPRQLAEFYGFTEKETADLCARYNADLSEIREWYDGYRFDASTSIYSPRSVIEAVTSGVCDAYWNQTETFEALKIYIDMNFDGLKDDILSMIAGESVHVNTGSFVNDMTTFHVEDDVLTLLIHLGYLGYDFMYSRAYIPNNEVRLVFANTVAISEWGDVSKALKNSADTLNAIWQEKPHLVSKGIEQAHFETSHLQYNDENALSYTLSLALYAARNYYTVHREFPTGKGFADLVFLPKKRFMDKPALIVELKWDKSVSGAIEQIKRKQYTENLMSYEGEILLVGINYDKKTKKHECIIERSVKKN